MVVGVELLLHLVQLLFLRPYGGHYVLGFHVGCVNLLCRGFHSAFALALGGNTRFGTGVFTGLYHRRTLVRLGVQNSITDLADRLTATRMKPHLRGYLAHLVERHALEFL